MDTSEQYIKQCEKAEEIQGQRPISHYNRTTHKETEDLWEDGDWFVADDGVFTYGGDCYHLKRYDDERPDLGSGGYMEGAGGHVDSVIWLPRQDQLQEMVLEEFTQQEGGYLPAYWLLHKFNHWLPDCRYGAASMEQLWLAFVMKEKYGKVWSGEEWVKID